MSAGSSWWKGKTRRVYPSTHCAICSKGRSILCWRCNVHEKPQARSTQVRPITHWFHSLPASVFCPCDLFRRAVACSPTGFGRQLIYCASRNCNVGSEIDAAPLAPQLRCCRRVKGRRASAAGAPCRGAQGPARAPQGPARACPGALTPVLARANRRTC